MSNEEDPTTEATPDNVDYLIDIPTDGGYIFGVKLHTYKAEHGFAVQISAVSNVSPDKFTTLTPIEKMMATTFLRSLRKTSEHLSSMLDVMDMLASSDEAASEDEEKPDEEKSED